MRMFLVKTTSASSFIGVEVSTTNYQLAKLNSTWNFNVLLLKVLGLGRFPPSVGTEHQNQTCSYFALSMVKGAVMQIYHALSLMCASHVCDLLPVAERPQPPDSHNILSVHKP